MVRALRPGGVLLVEDYDVALHPLACPSAPGAADDDEQRANRIRAGFLRLLSERGADLAYGRTLPRRLRAAGLERVAADAHFPVAIAAAAALDLANVEQVRAELISHGYATEDEIDAHLTALRSGRLEVVLPPLVSAHGYRPMSA